jgi:DNA-binding response OmpR family regulator
MMPAADKLDLSGLRVLVVEDALLIADLITEALRDHGCSVVGPVPRLGQGSALATVEQLDGALLDVNLAGERCFPIAQALAARGIPFAFLTG